MRRTITGTATRRRLQRAGLLLVAFAALALPIQALAGAQVPYKGSDSGGYTVPGTCTPGVFQVVISGTGHGTHVGRYHYDANECYDPVENTVNGEFTVTAANGDTLFGIYSGTCTGNTCGEAAVIEGGTGRFAGAQGQLDVNVIVTGPDTYSETASGTVSSPGSS
jgi:hypothetical protein